MRSSSVAQKEVERERKLAVDLGRKLFGDKVTDWKSLGEIIRADPQERFASADEIRNFTQRVYERADAAAGRMVRTPPVGKVVLEPFPEFQQATAPGGQYIPAADDGSRPATYLYGNVTADTYRTSLENVILHETDPGPSPADRVPRGARAQGQSPDLAAALLQRAGRGLGDVRGGLRVRTRPLRLRPRLHRTRDELDHAVDGARARHAGERLDDGAGARIRPTRQGRCVRRRR